MKFICLVIFILCSCTQSISLHRNYPLSREVYSKKQKFIPHQRKGLFGRYIAMNIAYAPVKELYDIIEKKEEIKIKNRGEAHITVITPIEFFNVLKDRISIKELIAMARKSKLQKSNFKVLCLGKGEATINGDLERTLYLVVSSQDLNQYRKAVEKLFLARGGEIGLFRADNFYPHITVGFSRRDLHESDGIIKNRNSCYAQILEQNVLRY